MHMHAYSVVATHTFAINLTHMLSASDNSTKLFPRETQTILHKLITPLNKYSNVRKNFLL